MAVTDDTTFDECLDEDATIDRASTDAVCIWWQLTEFLRVAGDDAVELLDSVATQDIAAIPVGEARHTMFLTNKAKIMAACMAYRDSETSVLLEMAPSHIESVSKHLKKYCLRRKASITHEADLATMSLVGPAAPQLAGDGDHWFASPAYGTAGLDIAPPGSGDTVHLPEGLPTRTAIGDSATIADYVAQYDDAHANPYALDRLRITLGVPLLNDFLEGRMPGEVAATGLGVAFEKGCYLGQEPVARLHYRGNAHRTLWTVDLPEGPGDLDDGPYSITDPDTGKAVGWLTSWVPPDAHGSPWTGVAILRTSIDEGHGLVLDSTEAPVRACTSFS